MTGGAEKTLVTGGARSGKSGFALSLLQGAARPLFIATAEPFDEEMRERIALHRQERDGMMPTREEPLCLARALREARTEHDVIIVDCLTVWLGNLFHHLGEDGVAAPLDEFVREVHHDTGRLVLVTQEIGLGGIPGDRLSRRFRDRVGRLNQRLAAVADRVIFMVSGIPWAVKSPVSAECGKGEQDGRQREGEREPRDGSG